ncbi:NAD-dependent epimerase/dehydratase family protein [Persicitalea jodogahamensis]|uniref:UDP-glucose 4-epimerase n=1 Tax=Persicitalea jodogahamensis TaxID=402147 RepID=A0A8J3D7Y5_9BACT|nr:NAD(P)-dependent oxidoreductase [Persicitalea jodogahamensis]GHB87528.1 UDP-glucose 4-epimerase [Persicitalea jodogahamensis]
MANVENRTEPGARDTDKELVIVTGSSGLIGTALVKRLAERYRIVGFDNTGYPFPPKEAECVCYDITSPESIQSALNRVEYGYGKKIASVVHLAAYYDFSGEPSNLYEKITVNGTRNLLDALQNYEVDQFVFSSTNLIYKPTTPGKKISEDSPLEPKWDYPESKVDTEEVISKERGDMKAVLLRIAGVYDEGGHSIPIAHQIQRIYQRQFTSHFYSGDITHGNVFVHLDDLIDSIVSTVDRRHQLPDEVAINIGEPETPSYQELQETIGCLLYGKEWKTYELPAPLAKTGAFAMNLLGDPFIKPWMIDRADDHYELDISRARTLLDWQPKHRLIDTLPLIISKLKKDPIQWYRENNLDLPSSLDK